MNLDDLIQYMLEENVLIGLQSKCRAFLLTHSRHISESIDLELDQKQALFITSCGQNNLISLNYLNNLSLDGAERSIGCGYIDDGLNEASRAGHRDLVFFMISSGVKCWNWTLSYACEGGDLEIIRLIISTRSKDVPVFQNWNWDWGLQGACLGNHKAVIELMISKGATNWNWGLHEACLGGHLDPAILMIEKGATSWNRGLQEACLGGHLNLVTLMIEKGADDWNAGFVQACRGGHPGLVDLMILNGVTDWNKGLQSACLGNHKDLVTLLISKGADQMNYGLDGACKGNHQDLVRLLISKGAEHCYCGKSITEHLKNFVRVT